jgi:hypothetical protein
MVDKQEFQKDFCLCKVLYFILHQMDKEELGVIILLYQLHNKLVKLMISWILLQHHPF